MINLGGDGKGKNMLLWGLKKKDNMLDKLEWIHMIHMPIPSSWELGQGIVEVNP